MLRSFERAKLIWDGDLSSNETLLLLALNTFIGGDDDGKCWPGQATLAAMCKFTERTVRNTIKSLEQKGILQKEYRYNQGHRTSNLYRVRFDSIPEKDSSSKPERDSARESSYRKITTVIPEKDSSSKPERDSADLSSIELSNEVIQCVDARAKNLRSPDSDFEPSSEPSPAPSESGLTQITQDEPEIQEGTIYSAAAAQNQNLGGDLLDSLMGDVAPPGAVHPAAAMEARMRAGANGWPWKRDRNALAGFLEYLANTYGRKGEPSERRKNIAVAMVRKANHAPIQSEDYQRIHQSWLLFVSNAQRSNTVEEATGQLSHLPPGLRRIMEQRRRSA
jgi:DNA-binding Lrp family transcriptional regulator